MMTRGRGAADHPTQTWSHRRVGRRTSCHRFSSRLNTQYEGGSCTIALSLSTSLPFRDAVLAKFGKDVDI
jgi:hypothetical protein